MPSPSLSVDEVKDCLKRLRQGHGLARPTAVLTTLPDPVRAYLANGGVSEPGSVEEVTLLVAVLRRAIEGLAEDERLYVEVDFNLVADHRYPTLTERQESLARLQKCAAKTVRRRPDRRAWIARSLPPELPVTFTSDWTGPFDGHDLTRNQLETDGYNLFPWQIESDNPWWSRPLKYGEVACTLAHLACWRHAAQAGDEPFIVILEDDAILPAAFLDGLLAGLYRLTQHNPFDLLYLGRFPLEPEHDQPALDGLVSPGYSHCTFGYLLTRPAVDLLLATHLERAIVPVDEFLPALYIDHPRPDLRARFPKQLTALGFDPPLVRQRLKHEAGSDTENSGFVERT